MVARLGVVELRIPAPMRKDEIDFGVKWLVKKTAEHLLKSNAEAVDGVGVEVSG